MRNTVSGTLDPCPVNKSPPPQGCSCLLQHVCAEHGVQGPTGQSDQIMVCTPAGVHLLLWRIRAFRREPKRKPDLRKGYMCVCVRQFDVEWLAMYLVGARLGTWRSVLFHREPWNTVWNTEWLTINTEGNAAMWQCSGRASDEGLTTDRLL